MIPDSYIEGEPLRLSAGPQLLLDDVLVEDRFNLTRVLHYPVKHYRNPILVRDRPWEGDVIVKPQVIWDKEMDKFRAWYTCFNISNYYHGGGPVYYTGYAESDNGFDWEKPLLDICPIGKYQKTNIVYAGSMPDKKGKRMFSCGQVFKDLADPDPQRRYKMIGNDAHLNARFPDDINTEPSLLISPDGLHWTLASNRPIFDSHSDTSNHLVYDEARGRWLMYCRPMVFASGRNDVDHRHHRRRLCVMTSKDLENWSYPRIVFYPDERDLPDYDHAQVFRYGSHFLMLYSPMDGEGIAQFETRLASSADGVHWHRFHTRENFLERGAPGSWDAGIVGPGCAPVPQGDNLLLYYTGNNLGQHENFNARRERHGACGVAIMKAGRFVAQRAGERPGFLLTREFLLEGDTLTVNISSNTMPYHHPRLRVEVLRHPPLGEHADYYYAEKGYTYAYEGFSLDNCTPLAGDGTNVQVTWKGHNLSELRGKPVYLRFELQDTDLYGFRIEEGAG